MKWPVVRFGDVARQRKEFVTINDELEYLRCRVQLHAQGVVERDRLPGALIKTKQQQVCRASEFLVAEIDAKHGGYGIVPDSLDGAIVSSHYFLFEVDETRLDKHFLAFFAKTPAFLEQVNAQGTTNYAAIRPQQVLDYEIPLPPLAEQRRIVAKIERVAGKVDRVYETRADIAKLTDRFLLQVLRRMILDAPIARLSDIAPVLRRPVEIEETAIYPEVGIRSFGKGTFHKPALAALDVGAKRLFQIHAGDLLFSNVFAWEGAIAVAQTQDHGRFGSHRFITCVPKSGVATAEYLCSYFLTPEGLRQIGAASPGGAGRNRTLGVAKLEEMPVPVPAYEEQVKFTRLLAKVNATRFQQTQTVAALAALLPAVLDRAFRGEL